MFGQKFEVGQVITHKAGSSDGNYGMPGHTQTYIDFRDSSIVLTFHDSTTKVLNMPSNYRELQRKKFYIMEDGDNVEYLYWISEGKTSMLRITNKKGRIQFLIFNTKEIK